MIRHYLAAGLILCLCVSSVLARPGTVRTKDGRSIEGDINDKGVDGVTIVTRVGTISLSASDVATIVYAQNIQEAYQQRLNALPKNAGAQAHIDLARWLYDSKEFELARTEADKALMLDPNSADAALLKQMIERSIAWTRNKPATPATPSGARPTPTASGVSTPAVNSPRRDRNYLSADQINAVRIAELKPTDVRIRVRFDNDVRNRFARDKGIDPKRFLVQPDFDKAMAILKEGDSSMRKDVHITTDPQAIMEYKTRIQPMILQSCATLACHGGSNARDFALYSPADNDGATYTNFYTLTQVSAQLGDTRYKMIDRLHPDRSLILQFSLPRERVSQRHPEVNGWTPMLRSETDPRYRQLREWVANTLIPAEPNYGFDFPIPGRPVAPPTPATAPSTRPAATK